MKKAAIFAAAAALVLTLAACGTRDDKNNSGANSNAGGAGSGMTNGGCSMGNAARDAVDGVERAVDDVLDGGAARGANMTSFQRMLDNARVHDTDGVLTDGENSRW